MVKAELPELVEMPYLRWRFLQELYQDISLRVNNPSR